MKVSIEIELPDDFIGCGECPFWIEPDECTLNYDEMECPLNINSGGLLN